VVFTLSFNKLIKPLEVTEKSNNWVGITARSPVLKGSTQFCCAMDQFCSQCSLPAPLLVANVLLDIANVKIISPEQPLACCRTTCTN
jgi:hypothetical protein